MGFLDSVVIPDEEKKKAASKGGGGFLSTVVMPTQEDLKVLDLQKQGAAAKAESDKMNSVSGLAKETLKDLPNVGLDFAKNLWETYKQTPAKLQADLAPVVASFKKDNPDGFSLFHPVNTSGEGGKEIVKGLIRSSGDIALAIFAPISAAVGTVLEHSGGQKLTDDTGKVIADSTGITDTEAFQKFAMEHPNAGEDFNRLVTLFFANGEKGTIDPVRMATEAHGLASKLVSDATPPPEGPRSVPVKLEGAPETKVDISTPKTKQAEYARSQGYEPVTPPDQLPTIEMGSKAKTADTLPVIPFDESTPTGRGRLVSSDYTYEPVKPVETAPVAPAEAPKGFIDSVTLPKEGDVPPPNVTATGDVPSSAKARPLSDAGTEVKVTKLASDIAQEVEKQFPDELVNTEDLATYKTRAGFMEDQAQKFLDLQAKDPELTKRIAMGEANAPRGLKNESVYANLIEYAKREGDAQTLLDLSRSKVATVASIKGQDIKALDVGNPSENPVRIIRDVQTARETNAEKSGGKQAKEKIVSEIKKEIKKNTISKQSWEDFVDTIKCSY